MDTRFLRYFGTGVFGLFALVWFAVGTTQILTARRWIRTATRVTGKVVQVEHRIDAVHTSNEDSESHDWVLQVAYEVDGQTRYLSATSTFYRWLYKPGQNATVLYTPGNPDDAVIYSAWNSSPHLYSSWIAMLWLGLMSAIAAILCFKMVRDF